MNTLFAGHSSNHAIPEFGTVLCFDAADPASRANHSHPQIELVCILSGSTSVLIGSHVQQGVAGDVFLIGSHLVHAIHPVPGQEDGVMIAQFTEHFFIDLITILRDFQPMGNFIGHCTQGMLWRGQMQGMIPAIMKLRETSGMNTVIRSVEVLSALAMQEQCQVLNQTRSGPALADDRAEDKIKKVFDYTQEHYREAITLSQIASVVNFTVTSFCRYFKKWTGKNYYHYLNEVRIDKACTLLMADGSKSIEEVCYITGYSSPSTFYKHFKKILNMTPKEYQDKARTGVAKDVFSCT
jgi:AraC-like DNA-binding protein